MNSKFANITATFLGCGLSKYAPGTMGSLGTIPLAYFLVYYGGFYALLLASVILFLQIVRTCLGYCNIRFPNLLRLILF